jgi:hypothetical protein
VAIPEHVVHRAFPSETVVLNLQTGKYHGLNPVAGRMFEELGRQETVRAAAVAVAEEYGEEPEKVERDLCSLCLGLAERGLISLNGGAGH